MQHRQNNHFSNHTMATANMYGGSVINGAPVWFNNGGFNHKMNRPYNGAVEDISTAFGGMQVYANSSGQHFNRLNPGFGFTPSMIPAPLNGHNAWANGRFYMPNAGQQFIPQGAHYPNAGIVNGMVTANQQSGDVPELAPRRNSLSSNEEFGPRTPFFAAHTLNTAGKGLVVPDNSPNTWTSPSPGQGGTNLAGSPQQLWREGNRYVAADFDSVCMTAPPIPRPIPAIFSGDKSRGTLETSLENKNKTTNVYIRGLHPDTTDDMLHAYGSRFGLINSAKSMIDQHTGLCKGFGFIKYQTYGDGENCIRGFYHWGYEAKWARESHNDKLKKYGDEQNSNLYISNIPVDLDFNEHALMNIFSKYDCLSAKILRDSNGLSRGVGFARFASPDVCRAIIQEFNGQPVGAEGQPIAIRFADTPDQKRLKAVTQERRQYKTHEYNVAAFGPDSPYSHYAPMVAASSPNLNNRSPLSNQPWVPQSPYNVAFPVSTLPTVGTSMADSTPLAGRTGPRFTPYPVALNAAKAELAHAEVKAAQDDTDLETPLAKRNTNLPAKITASEPPSKSQRQRENASTHGGSVVSSPVKGTPVKSSKAMTPKAKGIA